MEYREVYTSPYRTVQLIEKQAGSPENLQYAAEHFGDLLNGLQVWHKVKPLVKFRKDPEGIETIQGIKTFFNPSKNIHNLPGYGDCDCFTSILASIAKANKLQYEYIMQGNDKPSHIAIKINGTIVDLTNERPNYLRKYKKTQIINPMYVQLSDEPAYALSDLGRGGQGKAKFKAAAKKYGKFVIPAAAVGASLLIPGSGKVIRGAASAISKRAPRLLAKAQKIGMQYGPKAKAAFLAKAKNAISPGMIPAGNLPVAMPQTETNTSQSNAPEGMPEYTYPGPTITAQKINPMLLIGGAALAYFLFFHKKK